MESRPETKTEQQTNSTASETAETSLNSSIASVDLEEDFSEEEIKKAEEYKVKGNEAFKSKLINNISSISFQIFTLSP